MLVLTNFILLFLAILIAYWWANQGVFSALLHLACVVVAGAIALAFWEPLTVNLLLRGTAFDDYAWGISLVGLFAVSLLVLRIAMDKAVPGNLNMPQWVNFVFGFPLGAAAAIITLGILVTGMGFIQSHQQIGGYTGYGRSPRTAEVGRIGGALWLPVHMWTDQFYGYLSLGSLYPHFNNTPLASHYPELYVQASLVRDSFHQGRGKLSLHPSAANIRGVQVDERTNHYAVQVEFGALARDFGQQLTLSRSQVRLIAWRAGNPRDVITVHPDAWSQPTQDAPSQRFRFDDLSHYVTSVPGRETTNATFNFLVPGGYTPQFIQIRGTRFSLPRPAPVAPGTLDTGQAAPLPQQQTPVTGGVSIDSVIEVSNNIRPFNASTNQLPGTIRHVDNYLTDGHATMRRGGERPMRALIVRGIEEPPGTRIVQLDVSRGKPADIFGPIRQQVGDGARLALVDNQGHTYSPIGYLHEHREGITIRLDPARFISTAEELPMLPTAGTDRLRLLFRVTADTTIVGFRYGDVTVGRCNLPVPAS